jgi:hypothetical protein
VVGWEEYELDGTKRGAVPASITRHVVTARQERLRNWSFYEPFPMWVRSAIGAPLLFTNQRSEHYTRLSISKCWNIHYAKPHAFCVTCKAQFETRLPCSCQVLVTWIFSNDLWEQGGSIDSKGIQGHPSATHHLRTSCNIAILVQVGSWSRTDAYTEVQMYWAEVTPARKWNCPTKLKIVLHFKFCRQWLWVQASGV